MVVLFGLLILCNIIIIFIDNNIDNSIYIILYL